MGPIGWFVLAVVVIAAIYFLFFRSAENTSDRDEIAEDEDRAWRLRAEENTPPPASRNPLRQKVHYRTSARFKPALARHYRARGFAIQHDPIYDVDYLDLGDYLLIFDELIEDLGSFAMVLESRGFDNGNEYLLPDGETVLWFDKHEYGLTYPEDQNVEELVAPIPEPVEGSLPAAPQDEAPVQTDEITGRQFVPDEEAMRARPFEPYITREVEPEPVRENRYDEPEPSYGRVEEPSYYEPPSRCAAPVHSYEEPARYEEPAPSRYEAPSYGGDNNNNDNDYGGGDCGGDCGGGGDD